MWITSISAFTRFRLESKSLYNTFPVIWAIQSFSLFCSPSGHLAFRNSFPGKLRYFRYHISGSRIMYILTINPIKIFPSLFNALKSKPLGIINKQWTWVLRLQWQPRNSCSLLQSVFLIPLVSPNRECIEDNPRRLYTSNFDCQYLIIQVGLIFLDILLEIVHLLPSYDM